MSAAGLAVAASLGWAALGGGLGAALRYAVDRAVTARWAGEFPPGILLVNVSGSLALGFLVAALPVDAAWGPHVHALVGTGVLGGYTTFSAVSVEVVLRARGGRIGSALGYAVGTMLATAGAALSGLWLGGW